MSKDEIAKLLEESEFEIQMGEDYLYCKPCLKFIGGICKNSQSRYFEKKIEKYDNCESIYLEEDFLSEKNPPDFYQ